MTPVSPAAAPSDEAATLPLATRRYDLDWLRLIAIITLLFYHTGMIYVSWGWHIKSPEHSRPMELVMLWLHRWRMPLLFFIAGAGTFFALRKRSYGAYTRERVWRLFVPLVFGMVVVVPPQIYIEWLFRGWFSGSYADFYPEVLRFQPYREGVKSGAFSWHHLWFILYLFCYSLLSMPLFRWLSGPGGQRFTNRLGTWLARPGRAIWLVVPLWLNALTLGPFFPDETHGLVDDWAYFVKNLLLFWAGYLLISRRAFWQLLADQRRYFLTAMLVSTGLLYCQFIPSVEAAVGQSVPVQYFFRFNSLNLTWFSVLATVGYGYTYLNRNHRWLPQFNAAVYPFYIIHQTVIILVGYVVLTRTSLGVYSGFLTISLTSLLACALTYLLLIRPFRLMRVFFGVK